MELGRFYVYFEGKDCIYSKERIYKKGLICLRSNSFYIPYFPVLFVVINMYKI